MKSRWLETVGLKPRPYALPDFTYTAINTPLLLKYLVFCSFTGLFILIPAISRRPCNLNSADDRFHLIPVFRRYGQREDTGLGRRRPGPAEHAFGVGHRLHPVYAHHRAGRTNRAGNIYGRPRVTAERILLAAEA